MVFPESRTREHYDFDDWWTSSTDGTKVTSASTIQGDATYYAHWKLKRYAIVWNSNGGTPVATTYLQYGSELGTLPATTREGYALAGWFTQIDGG